MFVIDDAKLPPPTPAIAATISSVSYDTPGLTTNAAVMVGMRSNSALTIVQLRPPNFATAKVYGSRNPAPSAVGSVVSRNFSAAACFGSVLNPYAGVMNRTRTDQRLQIEKPMCSERMEKI